MDLLNLTRRRLICLPLRADEKRAALEELLDFLIAQGELPSEARQTVLDSILERESRLSTGMEDGVALPHGLTDAIEEEVAAIGISAAGVPFDAIDGVSARIIVLLLTPRSKVFRHVTQVKQIARVLCSSETRQQILSAGSAQAVTKALEMATETTGD